MSARVPPNVLLALVAEEFGVQVDELLGNRRFEPVATARIVAMGLCRHIWRLSQSQVGYMWRRHRTDVLHAERRLQDLRETDPDLRGRWDRLERQCQAIRHRRACRVRMDVTNLTPDEAACLRSAIALFTDDRHQTDLSSLMVGSHSIGWNGSRFTLHPVTS